jgi:hypothetical protein
MFKGFDDDEDDEYVPRTTLTVPLVAPQQPMNKISSSLFD